MSHIDINAGETASLMLIAADGNQTLAPKYSLIDDNGTVIDTDSMTHTGDGRYRQETINLQPGHYIVDYDSGPAYGRASDSVTVSELNEPKFSAAYDNGILSVEASISRGSRVLLPADLVSANCDIYDGDDNVIASLNDSAPDSSGVFRMSGTMSLEADRLYYVRLVIATSDAGTVVANKGFATAD